MNNEIAKLKQLGFKSIEDNDPELLLDIVKKIKQLSKIQRTNESCIVQQQLQQ